MFYTRDMEQEPGNKKSGENPWDSLRAPEVAPTLSNIEKQPDETEVSSDKEALDAEKMARLGERLLGQAEAAALAREYMERDREAAPERAKQNIRNMVDIQSAFEEQLKRVAARSTGHISRKEFEAWESDFSFEWNQAHKEMSRGEIYSSAEQAEIEYPIMQSDGEALKSTIEAQAGHFYFERSEALAEAIRSSSDPKRAEDLVRLGRFFASVQAHLDYKYTDTRYMDTWEAESYDRQRTKAHNDLIRHLNDLNDLARKYGVTPFTMRNFWTSDAPQPNNAVKRRMLHDRHQVEAFCANAFTREENAAKRRSELNRFRG